MSKRYTVDDFWLYVDKNGPIWRPDLGRCWEWTGRVDHKGYGLFSYSGRSVRSHRLSYELAVGPIPVGLTIDHLCRNRSCQNPKHLEAVTNTENVFRGVSVVALNRTKTECPHGHPLSGSNLIRRNDGSRTCRICRRHHNKTYRLRRKRALAPSRQGAGGK